MIVIQHRAGPSRGKTWKNSAIKLFFQTTPQMFWSCFPTPSLGGKITNTDQREEQDFPFEVGKNQCLNGSPPEDAITVKSPFLFENSAGYFALFEGHLNGDIISRAASVLLHEFLQKEILARGPAPDMKHCFEIAYHKTDSLLNSIASDRGASTTAWVVRRHDNKTHLHFSNVGCSRTILCRGSTAVCLSEEHTTSNQGERSRLDNCTAYTNSSERIRELIPVTRAIGDHLLKGWVISRPFYTECELSVDDSFIVCITRNISEFISDEEIVAFSAGQRAQDLSDRLVCEAAKRGARGSLSALAVRLEWDADISCQSGSALSGSSRQSNGWWSLRSFDTSSRSGSVMTRSSGSLFGQRSGAGNINGSFWRSKRSLYSWPSSSRSGSVMTTGADGLQAFTSGRLRWGTLQGQSLEPRPPLPA